MKKLYGFGLAAFVVVIIILIVALLFYPMSNRNTTAYLYIDNDDNIDSVTYKMDTICNRIGMAVFNTLVRHSNYKENVKTGRYAIDEKVGAFGLFRRLRNSQQEPVKLTLQPVRTTEQLAERLSKRLMLTREELLASLCNNDSCKAFGLDTAKIITLFIPNTYELYWNISVNDLLKKMQKENKRFWNDERMAKAASLGLTKEEVATLASIVEEETANKAEMPRVAGMYYNRLRKPMPLQADPTIKFALGDFAITRIYHNMLFVDSPYNTYKYEGLPPGPIRMASVTGIDAVLNMERHDYLYMCAKEDFSGTHNFAVTYDEHLQNAARYSKALNERNIGKYGKEKQ